MSEAAAVWGEESSDAELITAARAGDSSAFGALYERHAGAARMVARQYTRSSADAEDVVGDAFAKVYAIVRGGGGPDVAFRAYLFTVVRRLAQTRAESGRRVQPTDDMATFESAFGPVQGVDDPALAGFERGVVARAYGSLPERWQAVLWYTEIERLATAQIAPLLGLTPNGVAALAYRAREGLREAYLQQHLVSTPQQACRTINSKLGAYVRGGLAKRETAQVQEHLEGCAECRMLVLELGDVNHGLRGIIAPLVLGVAGLGALAAPLPVGVLGAGGLGAAGTGAAGTGAAAGAGSGVAGTGAAGAGTTAGSAVGSGSAVGAGSGAAAGGAGAGVGSAGVGSAGVGSVAGTGSAVAGATGAGAATSATAAGVGAGAATGAGTAAAAPAVAGAAGSAGAAAGVGAATAGAAAAATGAGAAGMAASGLGAGALSGASAAAGATLAGASSAAAGATALVGAGAAAGTAAAGAGIGGLIAAIPGGVAGAVTAGVVGVSLAVGGAMVDEPASNQTGTTQSQSSQQDASPGGPDDSPPVDAPEAAPAEPDDPPSGRGSLFAPLDLTPRPRDDPAPDQQPAPQPADPTPPVVPTVDPEPVTPADPDEDPVEPDPVEPDPVDPDPVDPDPVNPGPVDPDPVEPPLDPPPAPVPASLAVSPEQLGVVLTPGTEHEITVTVVNTGQTSVTDLRAALVLPDGARVGDVEAGPVAEGTWQRCADDEPDDSAEFCLPVLDAGASAAITAVVVVDEDLDLRDDAVVELEVTGTGLRDTELTVPVTERDPGVGTPEEPGDPDEPGDPGEPVDPESPEEPEEPEDPEEPEEPGDPAAAAVSEQATEESGLPA